MSGMMTVSAFSNSYFGYHNLDDDRFSILQQLFWSS